PAYDRRSGFRWKLDTGRDLQWSRRAGSESRWCRGAAKPFSSRHRFGWKPGKDLLQLSNQTFHLRLRADGDAHTAFTIRPVAQRDAARLQGVQDGLLVLAEAAQNKISFAGPALELKLLQLM